MRVHSEPDVSWLQYRSALTAWQHRLLSGSTSTDYWDGRMVSVDAEGKHYLITNDLALADKLEALPTGCEFTGLESGDFGFEVRPIHFTPVRLNG